MKSVMILFSFAILLSLTMMIGHIMLWVEELANDRNEKELEHHRLYTIIFFFIAGFIIFMRGFL